MKKIAAEIKSRFGVGVKAADGSTDARKKTIVQASDVVLSAAKAGVQVISKAHLQGADRLLVAADVNAVPPAGIEGLAVNANGDPLEATKAVGIGPLAIGNVKYKVEFGLFKKNDRGGQDGHVRFPGCVFPCTRDRQIAPVSC